MPRLDLLRTPSETMRKIVRPSQMQVVNCSALRRCFRRVSCGRYAGISLDHSRCAIIDIDHITGSKASFSECAGTASSTYLFFKWTSGRGGPPWSTPVGSLLEWVTHG
jgi:hypothetical protein